MGNKAGAYRWLNDVQSQTNIIGTTGGLINLLKLRVHRQHTLLKLLFTAPQPLDDGIQVVLNKVRFFVTVQ